MKLFEGRKESDGHSSAHNEAYNYKNHKKKTEVTEECCCSSSCGGTSRVFPPAKPWVSTIDCTRVSTIDCKRVSTIDRKRVSTIDCARVSTIDCKRVSSTTTQWFQRAGDSSKTRFLAGLLLRCTSVSVLQRIHNVLQVTSGKDFTYTRSKKPSSAEDTVASCSSSNCSDRAPGHTEPLGLVDVLDVWDWFGSSSTPDWVRTTYLLHVLRLCDPELLRMLGNLTSVLLAREKRALVQCLSHKRTRGERGAEPGEVDSSDDQEEDDPTVVIPGSSASLSGVRRHRDFLRCLPVHLAKRILGVLDKSTLRCCRDVSLHWRFLADETMEDMKTQTLLRNQLMIMQNTSNNWWVSDVFANMVGVPVPITEHDDDDEQEEQEDVLSNVHKDGPFKAVYSDVRTKMVEMEERNVYCGVYNVRVLLEKEDPYRTVDYRGGPLAALGSRDRLVRLLHVAERRRGAAPTLLRGHAGSVRALLLCQDRRMVISAGYDLNIRCWDLRTLECVLLLSGHSSTITCLDQQGDTLVSGAKDCKVKVWNLQTGRCREELRFRHASCVRCVKVHAPLVYSSCDRGLIKTWDLHHGALLRVINVHQRPVKCLYVDQWHLVSGDSDGHVMAWSSSCDASHCLNTFIHPKEVRCVTLCFLRLITGCMDGKVRIFHFLTGDCLRVLKTYSPVLSLHCHGFNVLVNTTSRLQLYQFAKVQWDYTASPYGGQRSGGGEERSVAAAASLRTSPQPGVSARARPPPSPLTSDLLGVKTTERPPPPPPQPTRRVGFLSGRFGGVRRREVGLTQRSVSSSGLCSSKWVKAYISLGPQLKTRPPSALSPGGPGRWRSQQGSLPRSNRTSHTPPRITTTTTTISSARGGGGELGRHASSTALGENAACERVKALGPPHRPPVLLTTPQMALRVNAVLQGQLMDEAGLNMELNGRLRDAWGSPPPPDPPETTPNQNALRTLQKPPRSFGKSVRSTSSRGAADPVLLATPRPRTEGGEHRPPPRSDWEETRPRTQPAARKVGLLDPFREQGGGFMLLTDVQLEEYILSHRNQCVRTVL